MKAQKTDQDMAQTTPHLVGILIKVLITILLQIHLICHSFEPNVRGNLSRFISMKWIRLWHQAAAVLVTKVLNLLGKITKKWASAKKPKSLQQMWQMVVPTLLLRWRHCHFTTFSSDHVSPYSSLLLLNQLVMDLFHTQCELLSFSPQNLIFACHIYY